DRQFESSSATIFETLRWTKSSPGNNPTISFAGTRLSAHPMHKYFGLCCRESFLKNSGSFALMASTQRRLLSKRRSSWLTREILSDGHWRLSFQPASSAEQSEKNPLLT